MTLGFLDWPARRLVAGTGGPAEGGDAHPVEGEQDSEYEDDRPSGS